MSMDNVNVIRNGFFAPEFSLSSSDGNVVSLRHFIADNFLAICFFSDRNSNRIRSILSDLNRDLPRTLYDYEVRAVAVSPDKIHRLNELKSELGLRYPLLSDPRLEAAMLYNVVSTSTDAPAVYLSIFVIDNEGIIRYRFIETGENEFKFEKFKKEISKII